MAQRRGITTGQVRLLTGLGWGFFLTQFVLVLTLRLQFEGSRWGQLSLFSFFLSFPFGMGLAIALLLIRRWFVGVLLLSFSFVTFSAVDRAANEVPPIPAPEKLPGKAELTPIRV